jgi:hypothetical protein
LFKPSLQDVLHSISSELNPNLLSVLYTGHALGSEANFFGDHDLIAVHQPEPVVPHFDSGMLVHSELASTSHGEFTHQLFG